MKNILFGGFALVVLLFVSCQKEEIEIDYNNLLIGTWVNAEYVDGSYTISRANSFQEDADGMQFKADGSLINRANSGWCATPPISYTNYEGLWKPLNDTLIEVTSAYWGGVQTHQIHIISIDEEEMVFNNIFEE